MVTSLTQVSLTDVALLSAERDDSNFFFPNSSPRRLLPRILEEQALREYVLALFRLPRGERLHEVASCSVWTPHARCHTPGTLYTTDSYLCFSSREEGSCVLLVPLSEVRHLRHSLAEVTMLIGSTGRPLKEQVPLATA